jgi:polysaccharide biosynthesis protein PslJ
MNTDAVADVTRRRRLGPEGVLSAYVVLLVLIPSAYTLGSFAITAAMVVGLVAAAMWLGGVLLPDRTTAVGPEAARRGVLVYTALMFVSYFVAMRRALDDTAAGSADRLLVGLLSVVGVSLLAVDGLRDRAAVYRLLGVLVASGGAVALIGILQYSADFDLASRLRPPGFAVDAGSGFVYARAGFDRVAGTARHPIEFGIVCAALLPIALHMTAHAARAAGRRASMLVAGMLGLALPMTLSRSAVLAAAVALAITLPGFPAVRRWRLIAGVAVVMWSVTLLAPGILTTVRDLFFGDAAAGSNDARSEATREAIDLFADKPWFGQGFGTLQGIIVDNQLLVTLVESGIIGIVALVALANGAVFALRTARRDTDDAALRDLGLTLIATVAAVAVGSSGLATLVYPTTSGLLFLSIGLAGAVHRIASGDDVVRRPQIAGSEILPARL